MYKIFRNRAYNPPHCFAMTVSQWAHQMFIWNWIHYKTYTKIQDWVYKKFPFQNY